MNKKKEEKEEEERQRKTIFILKRKKFDEPFVSIVPPFSNQSRIDVLRFI